MHTLGLVNLDKISDSSICSVASQCHKLQTLNLSYCSQLTDVSLAAIAKHSDNLKTLAVLGCEKILRSSADVEAEISRLSIHCETIS